jgi:hypothetical protein
MLFVLVTFVAAVAGAQLPVSVETGRDFGDGQVLYPTPYDPKTIGEITFVSPSVEHPFIEIVVPMGDWTEGASATVKRVSVNGTDSDSFYAFVDGFAHVQSGWITQESTIAKNVVLVTRSVWHNGEAVTIEAEFSATGDDGKSTTVTRTFEAKAPDTGGAPAGFRRYQSVVLHETSGLARKGEPVEFSLAARKEDAADLEKELRLFACDPESGTYTAVPVQTFNAKRFPGTPPGTSNPNYLQHPSQSLEGVFLASAPANGASVYVFFYDNPDVTPPAEIESSLVVSGPSLGATVENEHYVVHLDAKSGQIASFDLKGRDENPVPRLTNSYSNAVHWNPDSFSDNGKWGHTFAWDPPDKTVVTARGPLMFRITNSGRMPDDTPQVHASVTYSFYPGVPYVKCTTIMEVRDPLNASAIRNGEIVLDSHLIDHFVWKERNGAMRSARTLHGPNWQDEWAIRVDHDVPWLALTCEAEDYGIGEVIEASLAFNATRGEATTHRPAFYLYYHHFWSIPVTYFTRGWVYPFSDYQRGPIIPVDEGSTYIEKLAFLPFFLEDGEQRYDAIERASIELRQPLAQRWGR